MIFALDPRRILAVLAIIALSFTAACSSSDDDDASDEDRTSDESDAETEDPAEPLDLDDLLPGDDDVPADYDRQPPTFDDGDEDGGMNEELEAACPDVAEILGGDEDDEDAERAIRTWKAEDQRELEVEIRMANDRNVSVSEYISAVNACEPIDTVLNGLDATITLSAEEFDLGDDAVKFVMEIEFAALGSDAVMERHGYSFRRDGVAVQVSAQSGLVQAGPEDFEAIDADLDVAEALAADIDEAIEAD